MCDTKMEACNATQVPMESTLKISKAEDELEINATEYIKIIGCLRYLLHTRPDLCYADGVLSSSSGVMCDTKMEACNSTQIPMGSTLKISKSEDEPEIDATEYIRIIGCLRYLLHTRQDLCYAVGVLSSYMHNPRDFHRQAIKHILRYVRGTTNFGLSFKRDGSNIIIGYSNNSHNIDVDDRRITSYMHSIMVYH